MGKNGYVYILSNTHGTVYYTGVTSDLESRAYQHENGLMEGGLGNTIVFDLL